MNAPTYSELTELVSVLNAHLSALTQEFSALDDEMVVLREENRVLKARVGDLEAQVRSNSRRSPGSDAGPDQNRAENPPSVWRSWPLIQRPSSESRNEVTPAISFGVPARPSGW